MSDEVPDDIVTLAEEYLSSIDEGTAEDVEEVREELEYWEDQVDEFKEGTPMYEMAVEERDERCERLETVEAKGERSEEFREELLTRASTEFVPRGEWLEHAVVEALSQALTGQRRERLLVGEFSLPGDADDISKRDMVPVAKTVHALALDAVGGDDRITRLWNKLDTDTQLSIMRILAGHEGSLSSGEISDKLGENGTDSPGANIRYLRGEVDIVPYYSMSDGYTLSLAGKYMWMEYGRNPSEPDADDTGNGQAALDDDAEQAASDRDEASDGTSSSEDDRVEKDSSDDMDLSSFEIQE